MRDSNPLEARYSVDLRELASGVLIILVAAAFAISALRNLPLGSAGGMGPGYFPLMITLPLAAIGVVIVVRAFGRASGPWQMVRPTSLALVLMAPIAFALTIKGAGFLGAIALTVLVSAWASHAMTSRTALLVTAVLSILCVVIFYHLFRMPVSLIGPWLRWW